MNASLGATHQTLEHTALEQLDIAFITYSFRCNILVSFQVSPVHRILIIGHLYHVYNFKLFQTSNVVYIALLFL